MTRILPTLIALLVFAACNSSEHAIDPEPFGASMQSPDFGECPSEDGMYQALLMDIEAAKLEYGATHPEVRQRLKGLKQLSIRCLDGNERFGRSGSAPLISKSFSFNGKTFYYVPLDEVNSAGSNSVP